MEQQVQHPCQVRHIVQLVCDMPADLRTQGRQCGISQPFPGPFQPLPAQERPRIAVREIHKPAVRQCCLPWEGQDIPDLFVRPERHSAACHLFQDLQAVQQRSAGHVPVSGAFVTSAVLRQHVQVPVQHFTAALQDPRQVYPRHGIQHSTDHDVGKNPGGPVVQVLPANPHPPEIVRSHERPQDSPADF